jgi:aarF domain-containing kinase
LIGCAALVEYRAEHLEHNHDPRALSLPREYDWSILNDYWMQRPITTAKRFVQITYEIVPLGILFVKDFVVFPPHDNNVEAIADLQRKHASRWREALTNLGPAFIKAGQQISIRPDLVPPIVLGELQKLCDAVRPIPDEVAFDLMKQELKCNNLSELFLDMKLVAAASLGQVYQAKVKENGQLVAIKVQRPDMRRTFSLDLFLLQCVGVMVDGFTSVFTNQPPFHKALYASFAKGSYTELDYEEEAANQIMFRQELGKLNVKVVIPDVYKQFTTEKVITSEWIEGIKLADAPKEQIRKLIPVGVELFLTQLLDIGKFHSDPHPGNLLCTQDGRLCLIDFGLCTQIDEKSRDAMTNAIVHLLMKDFDCLVDEDAKELGFLPEDFDTKDLKPLIAKILTVGIVESKSDLLHRKRKLQQITNELNEVFFRYPFAVPPFFALVTRGLALLEGIALSGDPDFDIFRAAAPYARKRAVALMGRATFNRRMKSSERRVTASRARHAAST